MTPLRGIRWQQDGITYDVLGHIDDYSLKMKVVRVIKGAKTFKGLGHSGNLLIMKSDIVYYFYKVGINYPEMKL